MGNLTTKGKFAIAQSEAIVPTRYKDIAGVDTIYIGHTAAAGAPIPHQHSFDMPTGPNGIERAITEAIVVFSRDIEKYADEVMSVLGPDLAPSELDGWTKWHFNTGGIHKTSAVKMWLRGDKVAAVRKLQEWDKVTVGGVRRVSIALTKRRKDEMEMILFGKYPDQNAGIPVYATNGKGRVIWRRLDTVTFSEFRIFATEPRGTTDGGGAATTVGAITLGLAAVAAQFEAVRDWFSALFN